MKRNDNGRPETLTIEDLLVSNLLTIRRPDPNTWFENGRISIKFIRNVQFEWSRADVLNYNITISIKLMTFLDTNPSWYNASTTLSVPLNTICTGTEAGLAYDHIHVHTGIPNPELGGLAYQSTVCNARYRCGVSADGITTYATTVHEIGHNMGMLHDADRNCLSPDVGIMGGAGVGWSTCSCNDMNTMLQTGNHGCLWTDNIADNEVTPASLLGITLVPELPGQMNTADEVCEHLYGNGFRYREYPDVTNPTCNLYSCVDHNVGNTHGQMFKQSDSITGLYCDDQKICFAGACVDWSEAQLTNPEVRAGGWSDWGSWTTCSRTCGRGMIYRRRICNNPTPKNNAPCDGNEYEAEGCSLTPCVGDNSIDSNLIIQRATETCQRLIDNNIINGTEYTASGTIYSSLNHGVCEVLCESSAGYTRPALTRFGLIENGTPCPGTLDTADANQYSRRPGFYYACLEGYCQKFDCANTLNSGVFDGCGVCNGNNSTCIIREGNFTEDMARYTRSDWTEIPVGAYNIEISFVFNDMKQYYTEIFTKEDTPIITSSIAGDSRIFQTRDSPISFGGTLWHNDAFVAIMHAEGPLTEPVIVKVYNLGLNNNTGMKYIYSVPTNRTSSEQFTVGTNELITTQFAVETEPSKDVATVSLDHYSTTESIATTRSISMEKSTDTIYDPLSTTASTEQDSKATFISTEHKSLSKSVPTNTSISTEQSMDTTIESVTDQTDITTNVLLVGSGKSTRIPASITVTSTWTAGSSRSLQDTTQIMNDVSRNDTSSLNTIAKFNLVLIIAIISSLVFGIQSIVCFVFLRRLFHPGNDQKNRSQEENNKNIE
ncbi:ADAMTS1 [Mytilus coruscus]|uniref:ADAMTS1 n=1 Tax=Mytilus coruscus TaxID=42192 RepID=A0A6J8C749_MYTCO|nr:ADAMTS1 [Mytilus coruscus]